MEKLRSQIGEGKPSQRLATAGPCYCCWAWMDTGEGGVTRSGEPGNLARARHTKHMKSVLGKDRGRSHWRQTEETPSVPCHWLCSSQPCQKPIKEPGAWRSLDAEQSKRNWKKQAKKTWQLLGTLSDLGQIFEPARVYFLVGNLRKALPPKFVVTFTWNKVCERKHSIIFRRHIYKCWGC